MTRKDCEKKILDKLAEVWKIYQKYRPAGEYLEMCVMVTDDGELKTSVHNQYWGPDEHSPINAATLESMK